MSVGLVAITTDTPNVTELLKRADAACYMAKEQGRNRVHVYHPEDADLAKRRGEIQWVPRLHHALEVNQFCRYAQPIVPLGKPTDEPARCELLVRMRNEDGTLIQPGAFLPAAERYNLINRIDRWVITFAFQAFEEHSKLNRSNYLFAINLSGQSLVEPGMLEFIVDQLDAHEIEPEQVCFEITETAAISNLQVAIHFISSLRALGFKFALDDFGSGLSLFGYLKNLNVDYLKIDGIFVKDIVSDDISHAMVKSINEIGHVMAIQTIAEFVENDEIKGMLREMGVDHAQGYGLGKPQPLQEFLDRNI
jgi:EAL domain-containing protein (putative c-di-GMP-specific phosphodiesterase class I)